VGDEAATRRIEVASGSENEIGQIIGDVFLAYVLVIEDELPTQQAILKLLTALRYEALAVESAVDALTSIERRQPTVVISDYVLPVLDGLWLLKQIRERWPSIPVILITGAIPPEAAFQEAQSLGAVAFLGKPFTREELDEAIRSAIRRDS
jgi:CheY-like chemotaxis protein